jgi:hypothetical protein
MMRTAILHRKHRRGFKTTEEIQKLPQPQTKRKPRGILDQIKYRLDHPRFLERGDYDENDRV